MDTASDNVYNMQNYEKEEPLPPTIKKRKDSKEDEIFLQALAKSYNINPSDIEIKLEGYWKLYYINGHQIFKDKQ